MLAWNSRFMNPKKLPTAIGILVLLVAVPAAVYLSTQKEPLETKTHAGKEKAAVLYLWPAEIHASPGEEIEVRIMLSTQGKEVNETAIKLKYNPAMLDILAAEKGIIFNKYTDKKIDAKRGGIEIKARGNFNGTATFATLKFKAKKPGKSQINLIAQSCKAKSGEVDILQGVNGTILIIK